MKKEDISGLIVYLIIFAVAIVYGLVILQPHFANSSFTLGIIYALFILGAIAASVVVCALLFEFGHILGAKAGGYEIISVCILHFLFSKENGKTKVSFSNFDGMTGETKIRPKDEKSNPKPFLLLGTLFVAIFIVGLIVVFYLLKDQTKTIAGDMAYFCLTAAVVAGICLFYNILPFKLDSLNDGYRLSMVSNPRNKEAFNELLRVEYEVSQGNEVEIKTFTELTNFTADLNMNKIYMLLDKEKYDEADELLDIVLSNKETVSQNVYLRAISMKVYIYVVSKGKEEADSYVSSNITLDLRRQISDDNSLISIRAYLLIAGLYDNSQSECLIVLNKVYKAYKKTPKNRKATELRMFNKALELVCEAHPKWEFEKYKIEE